MKRILSILLVAIIGLCVTPQIKNCQANAQVRYYVCKKSFDSDGVQQSQNIKQYFTWSNNGHVMYISDQHGNKGPYSMAHFYRGVKNGLLVYQSKRSSFNMFSGRMNEVFDESSIILVSPDYNKINIILKFMYTGGQTTYVYERKTPGSTNDIEIPDTFY